MSIFDHLENIRKIRGAVAVALVDPDIKYDDKLISMIKIINESDFDIIFVGGSLISDNKFNKSIISFQIFYQVPRCLNL